MKTKRPSLLSTTDYSIFTGHGNNREIHDNPILLKSMEDHGFMPSSPIHCRPDGDGKLKVVRGHHRLHYAKRLKLPVWYIVDESNCDIFDLEACSLQRWSARDFAVARAKGGNKHCAKLLKFSKDHKLGITIAASLVMGHTSMNPGGKCPLTSVKDGTFEAGDMGFAYRVAAITDICVEAGIRHATSSRLVSAFMLALLIPGFDERRLSDKITKNPALLRKRGAVSEYLEEVETVYNHQAHGKRMPVKHLALENARMRRSDGRTSGSRKAAANRLSLVEA